MGGRTARLVGTVRTRCARRRAEERGAVTAELALGLPVLLLVTWTLAWLLGVVVMQVRVTDAAREAARAVARGDPQETAAGLARRVAPRGSEVRVNPAGETVRVRVSTQVRAPGSGLLGGWSLTVEGEAVALLEDSGAP